MKKVKEIFSKAKITSNDHIETIEELVKISKFYGEIQTAIRDKNTKTYSKISKFYEYFLNLIFKFYI